MIEIPEEIKQFNEQQFIEWLQNQLRQCAEVVLDSLQNAVFTFDFSEDQKEAMEGVFSLFRISLTGKFKSVQKEPEEINKIKLPSEVIVEAFDEAWKKQNGELPNVTVFEKIFLAMNLKDVYRELYDVAFSDDKVLSMTYEIKKRED